MNLILEIKSAKNLPVKDMFTSDPYVNVYQLGACESRVYKTDTKKSTLDPVWNKRVVLNALRGLVLRFEIFDEDTAGKNSLIAHHYFYPKKELFGRDLEVKLIKDSGKKGENATFIYSVSVEPQKIPPFSDQYVFQNPFYISVESENPINYQNLEPDMPIVLPFELSVLVLGPKVPFIFCGSSDSDHEFVDHSEGNICVSDKTCSPTIRVDPSLMSSKGYNKLYVILNSTNGGPLKHSSDYYNICFWESEENKPKFEKNHTLTMYTSSQQLKPAQKIIVEPSNISMIELVAVLGLNGPKGTVSKVNWHLPVEKDLKAEPCPPTVGLAIPKILDVLQYSGSKQVYDFPLSIPASFDDLFHFAELDPNNYKKLIVKSSSLKNQTLAVYCYDHDLKFKYEVGSKNPRINHDEIYYESKSGNSSLTIDFKFSNTFNLILAKGEKPFFDVSSIDSVFKSAPLIELFLGDSKKIEEWEIPTIGDGNVMLMFILFRDCFGFPAIINLSLPFADKTADGAKVHTFVAKIIHSVLHC